MIDLTHLSEPERQAILQVLQRDDVLRSREQERIRKLRTDVKRLRLKGVIKEGQDADNSCARCRQAFGWIFNKGSLCPQCQHRVCDKCRQFKTDKEAWLCVLCFKQMELEAMTNHWFYSKFRRSKRNKKTNQVISGSEVVRTSFRKPNRHQLDGTQLASNSLTEEVKRALYNNNTSQPAATTASTPTKSPRSARSVVDGDYSDTTSTEGGSSHMMDGAAYPQEEDKQLLMELIKPRGRASPNGGNLAPPAQVNVRRVTSNRYQDSDSDSSGPSSPQMSSRNESMFTRTDSLRSSIRSSSAVSSDGRITIVTDIGGVSDIETASVDIPAHSMSSEEQVERYLADPHGFTYTPRERENPYPQRENPYSQRENPYSQREYQQRERTVHNPRSRDNNNHKEVDSPRSSRSSQGYHSSNASSLRQTRVTDIREVAPPTSSDSETDISKNSGRGRTRHMHRSRTPSPDTTTRPNPNHHNNHHVANGHLAPPGGAPDSDPERLTTTVALSHTHNDPESRVRTPVEQSPAKSSTQSVPSTQPAASPRSQRSNQSDIGTEEDDNIDELFASHASIHSDKRGSNLLSPFSSSRESITSFYSDAGEGNYGKIPVTGDMCLGLDYKYKNNLLEVVIKQCRDLAPVDTKRKRSDPYIKSYLLPDKTKGGKRKTRVKKHTLNPTFDETLRYTITKSELENRTLWLTVWHNDTFGRNDFLGEVTIPMDDYSFTKSTPKWYPLQERHAGPTSKLAYKGDLIISLKFVTHDHLMSTSRRSRGGERGELHVLVKEAQNLTAVRANGSSDPFCKGYLLPERTKHTKQKTTVKKRDVNPRWNHTFVFEDIAWADLKDRSLELSVWDHDRFTSNDFLGGIRLNLGLGTSAGRPVEWMDGQGEEITIWQRMLERPNAWIDGSLLLRASMDTRYK